MKDGVGETSPPALSKGAFLVEDGRTRRSDTLCLLVAVMSVTRLDVVDLTPALQQRPPNTVHAILGVMVRVLLVRDDDGRGAVVAGDEGLVVLAEDVVGRV